MSASPLSYEEALRILRELHELSEQHRIVVIGGQAVALWYRQLSELGFLPGDELEALTSKDIDFRGSRQSVQRAATLLGGTAKLPSLDDHTASTGLVLFIDSHGRKRQIDFLDAPYGLVARDVIETTQYVVLSDAQGQVPVAIIHPQRLMESRVHNVIGLGRRGRLALRQAQAAVHCARAYSQALLESRQMSAARRQRAVLNLNERVYRFCRRPVAHQFLRATAIDPFEAVLVDHPELPNKFRAVRYPQMQSQLAKLGGTHVADATPRLAGRGAIRPGAPSRSPRHRL